MNQDNIIERYTKKIDNSKRTEKNVWEINNSRSSVRTEDFGRIMQSGSEWVLKNAVIQLIDGAEKKLILCSFLFADAEVKAAIIKAAERGVNIYMLMAAETKLKAAPSEDSEFEKRVYDEHLKMLEELSPYVYIRSADHFHAKIVISDPFEDYAKGILLTANITKDALERNEEIGYLLDQTQTKELTNILRYIFWEESRHHLINNSLNSILCANKLQPEDSYDSVFLNCNTVNTLKPEVLRLIGSAHDEIRLSTFGMELKNEVIQLIIKKLNEGVKVTIFCRNRPKLEPVFAVLQKAGAVIYGFTWLHAKAISVDNSEALIMTANLEHYGMDSGFELGVSIENDSISALNRLFDEWEESFVLKYYCSRSLEKLFPEYLKISKEGRSYDKRIIRKEAEIKPKRIVVKSKDELQPYSDDFALLEEEAFGVNALSVKTEIEKYYKIPKSNKKQKVGGSVK